MTNHSIDYLFSPQAIRDTTKAVFDKALDGGTNFNVNMDKLDNVINLVHEVTLSNYPDLNIPFHSRWGHFRVGGIDRRAQLREKLNTDDPLEIARSELDLAVVSVLLDAGAGMQWRYKGDYSKSEGLAVASFDMFINGDFSSDGSLVANSEGLQSVSMEDIIKGFEVSGSNPLVGVEGRVGLLNSLGKAFSNKELFKDQRPGNLIDHLIVNHGNTLQAKQILRFVLDYLGPIWPSRETLDGIPLGDVWKYQGEYVCFHKLSQWLTYSLIEPIVDAGYKVENINELTGLAEYRNGGLIIDSGLVELRDLSLLEQTHHPSTDLMIEWRALTVQLLDRIGDGLRSKLGKSEEDFPLCRALEGGTWWAGRKLAKQIRPDMSPPIKIESDGTVF